MAGEGSSHDTQGPLFWGCRPGGHGAVMVRQVTVTSTAVVFTKDLPEKEPALKAE